MTEIVFATNNEHKLHEARRIAGGRVRILSLADIGCHADIDETADTLEGNALIKARYVYERYHYPCFSDDTGLFVEALGGAPGVYTARYAGDGCTPDDNIDKMLREMQGIADRKACFRTVAAYVADGVERVFEGRVEGSIATQRDGRGGFGYDPIFIAAETGLTFASMGEDDKNRISHRGRALRSLFGEIL